MEQIFSKNSTLWIVISILIIVICLSWYYLPIFIVSLILAYLLKPLLDLITQQKVNYLLALSSILVLLFSVSILIIGYLLPFTINQLNGFLYALPSILIDAKLLAKQFIAYLPEYVDLSQVNQLITSMQVSIAEHGSSGFKLLLLLIPSLFNLLIYMFLVPILVFFLLKDSKHILLWAKSLLPKNSDLLLQFLVAINKQLGSYVRGKILEIVIVTLVSYMVFVIFGLKYSFILSLLVGFSVLVPIFGAVIATIPVVFTGVWQWGLTDNTYILMFLYLLILILDANVLVPWLFSARLNLHPVVVILAVLFFGNVWGFWGVFFAIPLAAIINVAINLYRG